MEDFNFDEIIASGGNESSISLIANIDTKMSEAIVSDITCDTPIPILPLKNVMLFPHTMLPVGISRKSSLKLVNEASKKEHVIGVFSQIDDESQDPDSTQIYPLGVAAKVIRVITLPDNSRTAFISGFQRVKLLDIDTSGSYVMGRVELCPEEEQTKNNREFNAIVEACKETATKLMKMSESLVGSSFALSNITDKNMLINFICANIPIENKERMKLLKCDRIQDRAFALLEILNREYQFATLKMNIQMKTKERMDKQQRDYFLRQEMEHIQAELGEDDKGNEDIDRLVAKAKSKNWSPEMDEHFGNELRKLRRLPSSSPDYQICYTYLETLVELPWNEFTRDNLNLTNAEKVLNRDHYGMEKVKERILEHLAVLKMRGDFKSPILCLYGPPGVGKTSLGKSIAKAMRRNYVRVSLGGVHDESEIRGHRRTYVGAMPGRIIKSIQKAGSSNPVIILDEIDKVSTMASAHGDPASALLEVLDPEQNATFHDNYLDFDYDLSNVMFIATANDVSSIPGPLLDRMELIEVSGYLTEEKIEIAKRHLIPKELESLGMTDTGVKLSKAAIEKVIEDYTRESGVRGLDKQLLKILRKITLKYAKEGNLDTKDIKPTDVTELLGTAPYNRDKYQGNDICGVVTGLAWTSVGGEILFIETSINEAKAGHLSLTGNLGDVMKESATIALQYLKANPDLLGPVPPMPVVTTKDKDGEEEKKEPTWADYFETHNIHVHVPEGATPKDGPSAGITIATSIASALTGRKVRNKIAMTGEITLRGKVLPIGGVKEKILAAKRAGITDIIVCNDNRKNIEDVPSVYVKGLKFHYVDTVKDVLDFALL